MFNRQYLMSINCRLLIVLVAVLLPGCSLSNDPSTASAGKRYIGFETPDMDYVLRGRSVVSPDDESSAYAYPYVVAILVWSGGSYNYGCSGVLVAKDWVLTAAHCTFFPSNRGCPSTPSIRCFIDLAKKPEVLSVG